MNNLEIRKQIDINNKTIASLMTPNSFVLNNTVANLLEENRQLQSLCNHEFEEGYCVYCDKEEAV